MDATGLHRAPWMGEPGRSAKSLEGPQGRSDPLAARGSSALFFGAGLAACSIGSVTIPKSGGFFALTAALVIRQNRLLVLLGRARRSLEALTHSLVMRKRDGSGGW